MSGGINLGPEILEAVNKRWVSSSLKARLPATRNTVGPIEIGSGSLSSPFTLEIKLHATGHTPEASSSSLQTTVKLDKDLTAEEKEELKKFIPLWRESGYQYSVLFEGKKAVGILDWKYNQLENEIEGITLIIHPEKQGQGYGMKLWKETNIPNLLDPRKQGKIVVDAIYNIDKAQGFWRKILEYESNFPSRNFEIEVIREKIEKKINSVPQLQEGDTLSSFTITVFPATSSLPEDKNDLPLCLTPDSLITLANGSQKPLLELKPFPNLRGSEGGAQGDMVLSLNEATGRLEPHRVLALLDMGVKPVYRITTASGKQLKTTLTHPYLTKNGWRKLSEIKAGEEIAALTSRQAEQERYSLVNGRVLSLFADDAQNRLLLGNQQELSKHLLAFPLFITSLFGIDKYTSKNKYYAQDSNANSPEKREFFEEIACQTYDKNSLSQVGDCFGNEFYFILKDFFHPEKIYHGLTKLSRHFLSQDAFAEIANPDILRDKIISIEPLGPMQVYDIEVEGTHNFVAEGIVAHNTYSQEITENRERRTEKKKKRTETEKADSPLGKKGQTDASALKESLDDLGGVDFMKLPIITQSEIGSGSTIMASSPQINISHLNMDEEWRQIQNMLNAGIIPSNERLREYGLASSSLEPKDYSREIDKLLGCIADILRLEEERVLPTKPALREMLVLLESAQPASELQLALSKIIVLPKAPQRN